MDPSVQKCLEITAQHRGLEYRDRAAERREQFGSADASEVAKMHSKRKGNDFVPPNPNVTNVNKHLDSSKNIGGKLMAKMGWTEGQSLGTHGDGIVAPINATEQ